MPRVRSHAAPLLLCFGCAHALLAQSTPPPAPPTAVPPPATATKPAEPPSPIMADDPNSADMLYAEEPKIKERIKRIDAEVAALDRKALKDSEWAKEWAGEYYEGDGLGTNVQIHLAPKAGVGYLNYGCMGLYGGDHGEVIEALPDGLKLKLVIGRRGGSYLSERVYFVKWGDRRYLVPEWSLMQMVNNFNEGGFAKEAMFGIPTLHRPGEPIRRWGGEAPPGKPELPPEFAKLLRDEPIKLRVTKVSPVVRRDVTTGVIGDECTMEFEGGTAQGAYLGLEFWYPPEIVLACGKIKITRVDATTSTGHVMAFGNKESAFKPPAVGEIVSTQRKEPVYSVPPKLAEGNKPADVRPKDQPRNPAAP